MKRIITILMLFPFLSIGQDITPAQLGVKSASQFTPDGQPVGAFMFIAPGDTMATIGYRTSAGYTYQLGAPFITGNYLGTAVSQEYVDSSVLSIPSLHIGARVPGGRPNTVLFLNNSGALFVDQNLRYQYDISGNSTLMLNSTSGYATTGGYQAIDTNGTLVMFFGTLNGGMAYNFLEDASGLNYIESVVADDGTDVEFDMITTAGGFSIQVDPASGGALFSSSVVSNVDFEALDDSANVTADMSNGFVTSMSADHKYGVFMQTAANGSTNNIGIYSPEHTVLLQQSANGSTWNVSLPVYPDDVHAAAGGLTKYDLYQDNSNIVHVKK